MFYRDIAQRHKVSHIKLLEDYLTLLIDQTASAFSISSTAKKLADFGYSLSKNTLSNFSKYAEEAFLVFETKKYSYKIREQLRAYKKLYTIDHGLIQAVRFSFSKDFGRIMENIVYIALKRKNKNIYYYKGIKECDFITTHKGKVTEAIQVSKNLYDEKTKKREMEGLVEALNQYKLKQGIILTEDEHETLKIGKHTIEIMPLWYWLLEN